jgi:hypothetical protein
MTNLVSAPDTGQVDVYAPGVLESYNSAELDQIDKVQYAGKLVDEVDFQFSCEVIRLKQLLDGQDQADGLLQTGSVGAPPSRFWDGARSGHFGEKLKTYAAGDGRRNVTRWVTANEAASILLGDSGTHVPESLPFELARKRGMGQTALCHYAKLLPDAKEIANHYFAVTGELRANMLQEFVTVAKSFPDHIEDVCEGITNRELSGPFDIRALRERWEKELEIEKALIEERERAARLAEAEAQEEELEDYEAPPSEETHVGDQAEVEDVTRRIAPSRRWFETDAGIMKVKEVVGDLPEPLPDLLTGLNGLNKALIDQAEHSGVMSNYVGFWAGYDRFAMSPSAAKRTWGQNGRLERMRKLRGKLIEVQQRIDMYIQSTTPPENMEYPET